VTDLQNVVNEALAKIHNRTFSGRHPELGKMIKCQVCLLRHRESIVCKQVFAKRGGLELIAGQTPETESVVDAKRIRLLLGAKPFKGKRLHPHLNKRARLFVELVRQLVPNEYTQEDLDNARTKAKRQLAKKYGRHGFLPPIWQRRKEANVEEVAPETNS
jgi:hypothetical protein